MQQIYPLTIVGPTNLSRRNTVDPEQLEEDIGVLNDVTELITRLNCPHSVRLIILPTAEKSISKLLKLLYYCRYLI